MFWSVRRCVKLCTTVSEIILYLFSTAEYDLCQTVQKCATLFKTVFLINLYKMSETYLLGQSLAQFYTVKYTYARLSTKIISTREGLKKRNWNYRNRKSFFSFLENRSILILSKVIRFWSWTSKRHKNVLKIGAADYSYLCIFMPFRRSTSNSYNFLTNPH